VNEVAELAIEGDILRFIGLAADGRLLAVDYSYGDEWFGLAQRRCRVRQETATVGAYAFDPLLAVVSMVMPGSIISVRSTLNPAMPITFST
jgi:hypothetical protein